MGGLRTYYEKKARERDPERRSQREKRDQNLMVEIARVHAENHAVYRARKVWKQLNRERISVAHCTVRRLMKILGLKGARRGLACNTTQPGLAEHCPRDRVSRAFTAKQPNQLWVADITFVSTWQGFAYVAFVIDVFSRFIVGWRLHHRLKTELVLDALEQAIWARKPDQGLIHHSDRGSQYLSIKYTERLAEAGIDASVGSVGDSYDNAMAETINGLYKTEVIHQQAFWKNRESVELATLEWVDWFNNRRLLEPIGDIPPAEFEQLFFRQTESANAA